MVEHCKVAVSVVRTKVIVKLFPHHSPRGRFRFGRRLQLRRRTVVRNWKERKVVGKDIRNCDGFVGHRRKIADEAVADINLRRSGVGFEDIRSGAPFNVTVGDT
jgi:hypothetical protein